MSVDSQTILTCSSLDPDGLLLEEVDEQAVSDRVAAISAIIVLCRLMPPD